MAPRRRERKPGTEGAAQAPIADVLYLKAARITRDSSSPPRLYGSATQLQLNPAARVFVMPGLAVGVSGLFARYSSGGSSMTAVAIGPSVGYFLKSGSGKGTVKSNLYPYLGVTALYTSESASGGATLTGSSLAAGAGFVVMVSEGAGLTTEVSYQFDRMGTSGASADGNKLNVILGFSAFLY